MAVYWFAVGFYAGAKFCMFLALKNRKANQ